MNESLFSTICYGWIFIAVLAHILLFFIKAPFGRHTSKRWGISINNKWGWFLMELPSLLIMLYFLLKGNQSFQSYAWILFVCWILHYTNRAIIYPLRIHPTQKQMPLVIVLSAWSFNTINATLNGYYLAELAPNDLYQYSWLSSTSFMTGLSLFIMGMYINWRADNMLIRLRKPGETGYKIPRGFLFDYVSSPNLFGEIIEWSGFALMAWNLPATTFLIWTLANLVPRAKNHHDWYRQTFADYPSRRKAVFPFLF
jgi:3-oxo-5-alpha-steroid 4-dehydrogenase 1